MKISPYTIVKTQQRYTSARDMLRFLGFISLVASGAFWYPVQWQLIGPVSTPDMVVAAAFGTFLVIGPPVFVSFFVPWSPAANLISRLNMKTAGQMVALAAMLYLVYYAGYISLAWWQARPLVAEAGLAQQQMIVGIIATIIAPALLWAPASAEELEEILKQDRLVRRYELQVQADLAILQGVLFDAQQIATKGLLHAIDQHGAPQLQSLIANLLNGIDATTQEIARTVSTTSGIMTSLPTLNAQDRDDALGIIQYIEDMTQSIADRPPPQLAPATAREVSRQPVTIIPPAPQQDAERELSREVARELSRDATLGSLTREVAREEEGERPDAATGAYHNMLAQYGTTRAWSRADLQRVMGWGQTKALDVIRAWVGDGRAIEVEGASYRYQLISEVRS